MSDDLTAALAAALYVSLTADRNDPHREPWVHDDVFREWVAESLVGNPSVTAALTSMRAQAWSEGEAAAEAWEAWDRGGPKPESSGNPYAAQLTDPDGAP